MDSDQLFNQVAEELVGEIKGRKINSEDLQSLAVQVLSRHLQEFRQMKIPICPRQKEFETYSGGGKYGKFFRALYFLGDCPCNYSVCHDYLKSYIDEKMSSFDDIFKHSCCEPDQLFKLLHLKPTMDHVDLKWTEVVKSYICQESLEQESFELNDLLKIRDILIERGLDIHETSWINSLATMPYNSISIQRCMNLFSELMRTP